MDHETPVISFSQASEALPGTFSIISVSTIFPNWIAPQSPEAARVPCL